MAEGVQVAAFEGGTLRVRASGEESREAVLALPLNRLLVRMVMVPAESREDPVGFATPILQAMSPYPDEPLTVSCETVRESAGGLVVIAAAMPESAADDIAEALDGKKLNVTRVDSLAIGALRGLWGSLGTGDGARRLVLIGGPDCISAVVLDGDGPSAIRAISASGDIRREIMLLLLEAEDFGGGRELTEIVYVTPEGWSGDNLPQDRLEGFAPVRKLQIGEDAALVGVEERSRDATALNALPASWHEVLVETRFKAKLTRNMLIAGVIWVLLLVVVVGVPMVYGYMTDRVKTLCKRHAAKYEAVCEMKNKVDVVRKYSDHARGALEMVKAISDSMPDGVTLTSFKYRRDVPQSDEIGGVDLSGEADSNEQVFRFKEQVDAIRMRDGTPLFAKVSLKGPTAAKGKQRFDLECAFRLKEER